MRKRIAKGLRQWHHPYSYRAFIPRSISLRIHGFHLMLMHHMEQVKMLKHIGNHRHPAIPFHHIRSYTSHCRCSHLHQYLGQDESATRLLFLVPHAAVHLSSAGRITSNSKQSVTLLMVRIAAAHSLAFLVLSHQQFCRASCVA